MALLQPPPRRRRWPAAALLAVTLIGIGGAAWTASTTEDRFERAQADYAVVR